MLFQAAHRLTYIVIRSHKDLESHSLYSLKYNTFCLVYQFPLFILKINIFLTNIYYSLNLYKLQFLLVFSSLNSVRINDLSRYQVQHWRYVVIRLMLRILTLSEHSECFPKSIHLLKSAMVT